jgi:hypothetical protein
VPVVDQAEELFLEEWAITELDMEVFAVLPQLDLLDLSGCNLEVPVGVFGLGFHNLRRLGLPSEIVNDQTAKILIKHLPLSALWVDDTAPSLVDSEHALCVDLGWQATIRAAIPDVKIQFARMTYPRLRGEPGLHDTVPESRFDQSRGMGGGHD